MRVKEGKIKRGDDSAAYLRVPRPLKAVGRWTPSQGFKRRALVLSGCAALLCSGHWLIYSVLLEAAPFRVDPHQGGLEVEGLSAVRAEEITAVFEQDLGQSMVSVDIWERLEQVLGIPWVRSARVGRVWPNKIAVSVEERIAVAFLRAGDADGIRMIDSEGVILEPRIAGDGTLPVLTGIDASMPLDERRKRIRLFETVLGALADRGLGQAVSEIDVSDESNAVVLAKYEDRMVKLQMGDRHLPHRLDVFLNYIEAWQAEFGPVESVDLRFEKQVAVQPVKDRKERG